MSRIFILSHFTINIEKQLNKQNGYVNKNHYFCATNQQIIVAFFITK